MKTGLLIISASFLTILATGCVERRVEYVPAYQVQPAYVPGPAYAYAPQTANPNPMPPSEGSAPAVAPQVAPPPVATGDTTIVAQAPPPAQVEVIPVSPGPQYVWVPGYWGIGVRGGWVWVGGHYLARPRPHAVWVGGRWTRHGHGYIWIGGHWR